MHFHPNNTALGVLGTFASIGLAQVETIAAISAGFATAIYMLVRAWQAAKGRESQKKKNQD
tara:strand:+ start:5515 stop:5697 length:183 start_codon:yes stop_codon:yes gene_type:complete